MTSKPQFVGQKVRLGDVVKIEKAPTPSGNNVWMLNLDAVEKDTGRVIIKNRVEADSVGISTIAFTAKAVLYSKLRPNLNKVVVADEPGLATSEMLPLITNPKILDRRYLAYLLRSSSFVNLAVSSTAGSKMPRVNKKTLLNAVFSIPNLESQHQRVNQLSAIEEARTKAELTIVQLDSFVKSRFVEMFGDPFDNEKKWPEYTLGSLLKIARGGSPRPIKKYITDDSEGINWIKIGDAVSGSRYIFGTSEKIKPSGVKKSRLVHSGDFLLSNSMSFGKPYILKTDGCIHDGWLVLQGVEQHFDSLFLYQLLASEGLLRKFSSLVRGGVVSNLNKDLVGSVSVMVPPITLQRKFADFVCQVDKSRFVAQQQIEKLQLLYDSLAQEYFGD